MPKFNKPFKDALDIKGTKIDWSSTFMSYLGNDRRIRLIRDANANAADPATTGTEFYNVGVTGNMKVQSGNISGFGTLTGATVKQNADISTGATVLRIEGNGNYVEYTVGLPGSGKEFIIGENLTNLVNSGIAFATSAGTKAPPELDSGTGPLSPIPTIGIVEKFRFCDWRSGSRVVVGTAPFSVREPNLVMQHAWMSREMGDVRQVRVPDGQGIIFGTGGDAFIFAGDYLLANQVLNSETAQPLQQVEIRAVPYGRWTTFPFRGDFNIATDTTVPGAHKIELLDGNDNIVDVIEMYSTRDVNNTPGSGKPVNAADQNQVWDPYQPPGYYGPGSAANPGIPKPVQPWWNCLMVHSWQSHMPKKHSMASHFLPGVEDDALHPSNVAAFDADPEQWPVITNNFLQNGLGSYKVCPKWSRAPDTGLDTADLDTHFVQFSRENYITQAIGYGFEPGSVCKHTWYMAPGGSRHDRAGWPHIAVVYMSAPNGVRVHGSVPHRTLWHHWTMGYFNHAHHYHTDVYRGYGIPKPRILAGETCFNDTYYNGGNESYRPNLATSAIRLLAAGNGNHPWDSSTYYFDKNGRSFTNQYTRDVLHNFSTSAIAAYLTVSPRHVLNARHSFTAAVTAAFEFTQGVGKESFLTRGHAWYLWMLTNTWMVGNEHPDGFTALEIEDMTARHLEQCYDLAMPEYLAQNTVWGVGLKRFGIQLGAFPIEGSSNYQLKPTTDQDPKIFYFGQVFLLMKQSGFWEKMCTRSPKCKAVLESMMEWLATYAIGVYVDTNGRADYIPPYESGIASGIPAWPVMSGNTVAHLPASWLAFSPVDGQKDLIHNPDGSLNGYMDGYNTTHFRAQYLWILRDYFPEYTFLRHTQAINVIDGFYNFVKQGVLNGTGPQWHYRFASMGKFKVADYIGAPI